jgi:hypothetical protein
MSVSTGFELLTDARGGAIQVIRFNSQDTFQNFASRHISRNRVGAWKSLELAYLREKNNEIAKDNDNTEGHEEVLILYGTFPEVHIHGGSANLNAFLKKVQSPSHPDLTNTVQDQIHAEKSGVDQKARAHQWRRTWEESFSTCFAWRSIQYMLDIKKEGPNKQRKTHAIEGYAFLKPIKCVLVGPPNAGKSTLFNHLLGEQRALISNIEGTTRDLIKAHLQIDGYPFELIDSAGLDPTALTTGESKGDGIQEQSARLAIEAISSADLIFVCRCELPSSIDFTGEIIHLHSKCDVDEGPAHALHFSVKTKTGLKELHQLMMQKAAQLRPEPVSSNFFSAEPS